MVEPATEAVGGDRLLAPLVRCSTMWQSGQSLCFSENQGRDPISMTASHQKKAPGDRYHVADGLRIAKKYHLPPDVTHSSLNIMDDRVDYIMIERKRPARARR